MEKELDNLLSKPASYYREQIIQKNPKFDFKKPVVLFGAAKMGFIYVELCKKTNIKIITFCDNDRKKNNTYLKNILIISPQTLQKYFKNNTQIIVTSLYDEEIIKQLSKLGFKNVWSHTYFSTLYAKKFSILAWTNYINDIINSRNRIIKCFNYLDDNDSKRTFINILKYRLTLDRKHLKDIYNSFSDVYFDQEIIYLDKSEVFLDGGAYNGDTIKPFLKLTKKRFKKAFCFEPDLESYSLLKDYVRKELKNFKVKVLPYGLGKNEEIVYFTNEGNLQSKISNMGRTKVKLFPIDKYIYEKFTFIKLDIEGYEKEALLGAKKTIKRDKPKLAVCVYHYQTDLWNIPLLIKKINPRYKIYLRHYNQFLFDTICYAT